jgi:toxin-antitoxin system PIN domain toxin
MIAVDTNILVYAHREDSVWHEAAYAAIARVAEGGAPWSMPAPCLHEFLAITTHPKIYRPPTPLSHAIDQLDAWCESPSLVIIAETDGYWARLRSLVVSSRATGGQVHDARVAALCLHHGVAELWSADRDFSRFPELRVRNPLVGPSPS